MQIDVLDHGYVKYLNIMGSDEEPKLVCDSNKTKEEFNQFILGEDPPHMSVLEQVVFQLEVKAPIFVARQWFRHRTVSIIERSMRYREAAPEFYIDDRLSLVNQALVRNNNELCWESYRNLLSTGVPRESARVVLPVNIYTTWTYIQNLRNLLHFLSLRNDSHAQYEIRNYAKAVEKIVSEAVPDIYQNWVKYVR